MPCHAMHLIQDLFLDGFSYILQIDMHFICTPMWTKFYSCKKWVLQIVSPSITNIKLYHFLIDGGAALNLISLADFRKLQILMPKLQPSWSFSGVGPVSVMPCGCISFLITFGTSENFHTESVLFDVVEVNLPFNAILGRPGLY
jgi:hypothetical protein